MPGVSAILSRVPPEHRQKLMTPLSAEQSGALRTMLTAGLARPLLPPEISGALIEAGYAKQALGGVALTDQGQVRAMMENGQ